MNRSRSAIAGVAALVVLGLAVAPVQAGGRARKSRSVVAGDYTGTAGVWVFQGDAGAGALSTDCAAGRGCVVFPVPAGATTVSLDVQDDSGQTPVVLVGGAGDEGWTETCDSSTGPLPLEDPATADTGGSPTVMVTLATGLCPNGGPALATAGTVTATFGTAVAE